jgi:hypothetical protein
MKKLIIITVLSFFALNISAQNTPALDSVIQSNIKAEKKALIKHALVLTDQESKEFWPLYDEYNEKKFELNKGIIDLVMKNAEKLDSLTDEEAEEIWREKMDFDYKMIKLEKKYFKKMLKVLPGGKAVRYFQAESKIQSMISAQEAVEIPLINTPK